MEIISFTKKELLDNINNSSFFNHNGLLAVSKQKINWILDNNRIEDTDYCLLIAKDSGKLASYVFLIPDLIKTKQAKFVKFHWMYSWWLSAKYEKTIIGSYLYNEAIKLTDNKVLIESYTENTVDFYSKQPYYSISDRLRYTCLFRLDENILIDQYKFLKPIKKLVQLFDSFLHFFTKKINSKRVEKSTNDLKYEYISSLNLQTWNFISPFLVNDITYKTKEYVNWQLSTKQYVNTPIQKKIKNNSVIKGFAFDIKIVTYNVYLSNEIIGFVSYLKTNYTVYLKYFVSKEGYENKVADSLIEHLLIHNIKSLYTDDSKVAIRIKSKYITIYNYSISKKALAHTSFKDSLAGLTLSESDGNFH